MFCTNCGAPLSEGARFCPTCGTPVEREGADAAPAPTAKGKTRRPIIIAVAVVAVIALVAGLVIWKGVGRAAKGNNAKTAASAQSVKFDDSTPAAIVTTALRAGMQGDVSTMLKTLNSDQRKRYSNLADPSSYDVRKTYRNLTVGTVEAQSDGDYIVDIVRGGDAERYRYVKVEQVASGGYRVSDADGLWLELEQACNDGGYAPLGAYEYSCSMGGLHLEITQKPHFSEGGTNATYPIVSYGDKYRIVDMAKARKVLVENLDLLRDGDKGYQDFMYSDLGQLRVAYNRLNKSYGLLTATINASYDDGGQRRSFSTVTMDTEDWYRLIHVKADEPTPLLFDSSLLDD